MISLLDSRTEQKVNSRTQATKPRKPHSPPNKEAPPIVKVARVLVAAMFVLMCFFTGYHTWNLFARGATTEIGQTLAIVPSVALDGSMLLLMVLVKYDFKDKLQRLIATIFNVLLFVIIGVIVTLDFSLAQNELLTPGFQLFLKYGLVGSLLFSMGIWTILFHVDPSHQQPADDTDDNDDEPTQEPPQEPLQPTGDQTFAQMLEEVHKKAVADAVAFIEANGSLDPKKLSGRQ